MSSYNNTSATHSNALHSRAHIGTHEDGDRTAGADGGGAGVGGGALRDCVLTLDIHCGELVTQYNHSQYLHGGCMRKLDASGDGVLVALCQQRVRPWHLLRDARSMMMASEIWNLETGNRVFSTSDFANPSTYPDPMEIGCRFSGNDKRLLYLRRMAPTPQTVSHNNANHRAHSASARGNHVNSVGSESLLRSGGNVGSSHHQNHPQQQYFVIFEKDISSGKYTGSYPLMSACRGSVYSLSFSAEMNPHW
eukprot:CAMPEP_0182444902 /NCGR_PEP_ID=MMETSP1172-20130603/3205_1 /TAXON_ID=708627 /ORGANISM="Timspurckia oligopyrenoides, Strain CCMP3278" /LENGTH=249 /DNA_ID=CAMNT_0024640561 /DNA_START=1300 /DNA_END=2046 /DNA_ORIENTATION=-